MFHHLFMVLVVFLPQERAQEEKTFRVNNLNQIDQLSNYVLRPLEHQKLKSSGI